jgi:hypothetical protein
MVVVFLWSFSLQQLRMALQCRNRNTSKIDSSTVGCMALPTSFQRRMLYTFECCRWRLRFLE